MSSDDVWRRDEVESPCVKLCVIHPEAGLCAGCLRTLEEITKWSQYSNETRARIIEELPERRPQLTPRRRRRDGRYRKPD